MPPSGVRALVWTGSGPEESGPTSFAIVERPLPVPGPGELLVQVRAAAICGSDRHTVQGRRPAPCPSVLGHEGVGEIVALGGSRRSPDGSSARTADRNPPSPADPGSAPRAVDGSPLRIGDRIVWSVTSACGSCDRCLTGHSAKCRRLRKTGHEGFDGPWPHSGTYATHVLLPAGHDVARVPDALPDAPAAVAACAGATVMAALDAVPAARRAGARALVSGVGMLGLLAIAAMAGAGAGAGAAQVHAIDPSAERRELALQAGAHSVATPAVDPPDGLGELADLALEFSGTPAGVSTAISSLDVGGTAVLAGSVFPGPSVAIDPEHLVRGRRSVVGVHNYEPQHLAHAVDLLATERGRALPWSRILSAPITLDEVPAAFAEPTGHLRTIVIP